MLRRARTGIAVLAALGGLAGAAATPATAASPSRDLALALRFRPLLMFDSAERWRPLDVDRFLREPGMQACPPLTSSPPAPCAPFAGVAQLTPAVAYLDLRGSDPEGADATAPDLATCPRSRPSLLDCDLRGRSKIYAHVVRSGRRIAIDYWWFLRYNAFSLDEHEGDWEGVTVIADPAGRRVLDVRYAAHADVWRYDRGVPLLSGRHVEVFVARGDHAAYPRACVRRCRETGGTLPEARFDGRAPWVGNTARGCRGACVRLLPAAPDGAPASWDAWDGRWGAPYAPAFPAPLTPAFQARFRHPFASRHSGRRLFRVV
ncbi:MAG TPA: hypothetical protein VFU94_13010 [Conexibacter sp.]|nr:hypothetical protein [Conexibacter sp.]